MTDIIDQAVELEDRQREEALARQRARTACASDSATICVDCGDTIPRKRRLAAPGCVRCIECERISEARGRLINR